jgi:hypothetical protein
MDTDELTEKAYEVIRTAHSSCPIIGANLAIAGAKARSEDEFLKFMLRLVSELAEDPGEIADEVDSELTAVGVAALCDELKLAIMQVLNTPVSRRGKLPFP